MAFWFGKKNQSTELREATLPGEMGTISFPTDFVVQMESQQTIIAQPERTDAINLRASSFSLHRDDCDDETAGKFVVQQMAEERALPYTEIGDKGMLSYEEASEQDGVPLVLKFWYIGSMNTVVIFSASIIRAEQDSKAVKDVLDTIPDILESLKITTIYRAIAAEDRKVEAYATTTDPIPQTIVPFGPNEIAWLEEGLEAALALGVKFGSGGDLTPEELDVVFSRWMHDDEEKEADDLVANALGAAFGSYLVEQHGFRWVVVTDEYGTEFAVRHDIGETKAFPRSSVQKRIEDKCSEFFQNVYLIVLDQLKRSAR